MKPIRLDNYEILGVATQSDDSTVRAFSDELKINFPLLPDVDSRVVSLYHVLPTPDHLLHRQAGDHPPNTDRLGHSAHYGEVLGK